MTRSPSSTRPRSSARAASESRLRHAFASVPRHWFEPQEGSTQESAPAATLPSEDVAATMLTALELSGSERALDVGSPTPYQAALLSHLVGEVISIERDTEAAASRRRTLASLGCGNVRVVVGEATGGWWSAAPYHAILVGAAVPRLPAPLLNQLSDGGRLVLALGDQEGQLMQLIRKRAEGVESRALGACHLAPLPETEALDSPFPWVHPHAG